MEKQLEDIEKNELKAEALTEVIDYTVEEGDSLKTVWDEKGGLQAIKVNAKAPLPANPEELRARVAVLGNAWMFAGFANPSRKAIQGIYPQLFQDYLDYLLGEYVWGLNSGSVGKVVCYARPSRSASRP